MNQTIGGYICSSCGYWVFYNQMHNCQAYSQPQSYFYNCQCALLIPLLERIAKALELLAEKKNENLIVDYEVK